MTAEESYEQAGSNSGKWNFKNKPCSQDQRAGEPVLGFLKMKLSGFSWRYLLLRCLRGGVIE